MEERKPDCLVVVDYPGLTCVWQNLQKQKAFL